MILYCLQLRNGKLFCPPKSLKTGFEIHIKHIWLILHTVLAKKILAKHYQGCIPSEKKGQEEAQIGAGENRSWRAQGCIGCDYRRCGASWRLLCHDHFLLACGVLINFFLQVHFFGFRVTGIDEKGGATRLIMCVCARASASFASGGNLS